jgi:hypothetical protein
MYVDVIDDDDDDDSIILPHQSVSVVPVDTLFVSTLVVATLVSEGIATNK